VFITHSLVTEQDYIIYVDIDGNRRTFEYVEFVPWSELSPRASFWLNEGYPV